MKTTQSNLFDFVEEPKEPSTHTEAIKLPKKIETPKPKVIQKKEAPKQKKTLPPPEEPQATDPTPLIHKKSMHNTYTKIVASIQRYFKEAQIENAVIGVSGGVDSALCLKLVVDALGAEHVTGITMPEKGVSSDENLLHARTLCQFLNVNYYNVPINKYLTDFLALPWKPSDLAQINTKARVRMVILYNFANSRNSLVIGTSNKSELALGYGTKYGDLAADLEIIGDLFKDEVYKLAEHVGLPNEFIEKAPSAELYNGQTDETELGMTYREIDIVLRKMEEGLTKEELIGKGISPNIVHKVFRLYEINKHKLNPPYLIRVK
ncbi:MAG: NAD+ synthase [Candidatus Peregrinibacteria bacterium]|nr:NAD+ synthase [Candidatus Peregrinibacteria bacterium]